MGNTKPRRNSRGRTALPSRQKQNKTPSYDSPWFGLSYGAFACMFLVGNSVMVLYRDSTTGLFFMPSTDIFNAVDRHTFSLALVCSRIIYFPFVAEQTILDELKLVLEEDAAVFMTKMWRMLVFCTLRSQERALQS